MLSLGLVGMSLGPSDLNEVRILVGSSNVSPNNVSPEYTVRVEIVLKGSDLQGPLTALQAWFPGTELYDQDTPLSPEALQQAIGLQTSLDDIEDPQFSRLAKILRSRFINSLSIRCITHIKHNTDSLTTPHIRECEQRATDPIFSNAKNMYDYLVASYNPTYRYLENANGLISYPKVNV
jgi:hypothetical protein